MTHMGAQKADIHQMPRGGPDASWLDRLLETDRPEYVDRDDVDERKRKVVRGLERMGNLVGIHKKFARRTLDEVADIPDPKIANSARATARCRASCCSYIPPSS